MKIVTWNVNSLRARLDLVLNWIEVNAPDIICLQETKTTDQEFPEDEFGDLDYDIVYFGQPSYNGVAIAARDPIKNVVKGFPGALPDDEKRLIAATINGIRIINIYLPNGNSYNSDKYRFKLQWMDNLQRFIESGPLFSSPLILLGDFNVAPRDEDIYPAYGTGEQLFISSAERDRYRQLIQWGMTDMLEHFHPDTQQYTWWDYRGAGFQRDEGMRIDHILATHTILSRSSSCDVDRGPRAEEHPSDHAPVILRLKD
ncbi:MAG: exodeoxyribonuclease III [Myxococcales bacterium]|nr:exodeoxyribonuclease III [Myxococcales bacterium]